MTRVLLLEDERELREEVASYLRRQGHEVVEVSSIKQFHQFFQPLSTDVLMLDRMLPDGDGLELASELRSANVRSGIIIFTARDASKDRLEGFRTGADHYVSKPVRLEELGALIKALSWRMGQPDLWQLDVNQRILKDPDGVEFPLTTQEFAFLKALEKSANKAMSRDIILESMGKDPLHYDARNLDALVLRLRKKIEMSTRHTLPLKTVHGVGYVIAKIASNE